MNKFKKEDIDLILNHPDVQTTQVLSDLIGESMQLMHVWKKLGISDAGLKKINSCDYLVNLDLSKKTDPKNHVFLKVRKIKKIGVLVISSDKGLCGGLNSNISKL